MQVEGFVTERLPANRRVLPWHRWQTTIRCGGGIAVWGAALTARRASARAYRAYREAARDG